MRKSPARYAEVNAFEDEPYFAPHRRRISQALGFAIFACGMLSMYGVGWRLASSWRATQQPRNSTTASEADSFMPSYFFATPASPPMPPPAVVPPTTAGQWDAAEQRQHEASAASGAGSPSESSGMPPPNHSRPPRPHAFPSPPLPPPPSPPPPPARSPTRMHPPRTHSNLREPPPSPPSPPPLHPSPPPRGDSCANVPKDYPGCFKCHGDEAGHHVDGLCAKQCHVKIDLPKRRRLSEKRRRLSQDSPGGNSGQAGPQVGGQAVRQTGGQAAAAPSTRAHEAKLSSARSSSPVYSRIHMDSKYNGSETAWAAPWATAWAEAEETNGQANRRQPDRRQLSRRQLWELSPRREHGPELGRGYLWEEEDGPQPRDGGREPWEHGRELWEKPKTRCDGAGGYDRAFSDEFNSATLDNRTWGVVSGAGGQQMESNLGVSHAFVCFHGPLELEPVASKLMLQLVSLDMTTRDAPSRCSKPWQIGSNPRVNTRKHACPADLSSLRRSPCTRPGFSDAPHRCSLMCSAGNSMTREAHGAADNVYLKDGALVLRSRRPTPQESKLEPGVQYYTGAVSSRLRRSFRPGRLCVSAKLPGISPPRAKPGQNQGLWPAHWLLPIHANDFDQSLGCWPDLGEVSQASKRASPPSIAPCSSPCSANPTKPCTEPWPRGTCSSPTSAHLCAHDPSVCSSQRDSHMMIAAHYCH